ncbi:Phosphoribosylamine--glycine ligase [hydrothermal vent metagenome]|uniref:Phosphoribosylamine--glycine ligase n=1 Tax=hydrothermal vent metagenome TaxID=652676 RepID=A0A3B0VUG1_9ZZZZ
MKILIVGGGGREHALAWKLCQSPLVTEIFIAPGNAGTANIGQNINIEADDIEGLMCFALDNEVDLTVVGPEVPLTLGITDLFEKNGLEIFGPSRAAARLEGSKLFSKELMTRTGVPTASYEKFTDADAAKEYIKKLGPRSVIKADGLAAGKGAVVCQTTEEALAAIDLIMVARAFGDAGDTVVIEEFLCGEEASFIAITDGKTILPLATSQDHKAVFEGDTGPNTGGMGAYSPAPVITPEMETDVMETVIRPIVEAMAEDGTPFKGILYAGVMITAEGIKVLEYNCRLGDPETQPILMRLENDLAELLLAAAQERLSEITLNWSDKTALCVVMTAEGYPGSYRKGDVIEGLQDAADITDAVVFHAGTAEKDGAVTTCGGRVLGVTGLGENIEEAIKTAYTAVEQIRWDGAYYRRDIGAKALKNQETESPEK